MKKLNLMKKSKQAGFAMIEILLMIGVLIALTAVMVYALYGKVSRQSKVQTASEQMVQIASSVRSYVKNNQHGKVSCFVDGCLKTGKSDDMKSLGSYGLEQSISDQSATANPWAGGYTVDATKAPTPDNTFIVKMNKLPEYMVSKSYLNSLNTAVQHAGDRKTSAVDGSGAATACVAKGKTVTCTFNL